MSDLRAQLQTIYDEHGVLTPAIVVDVARPKDHPLHVRVFDLGQRDAAEAWYRERAHELIRSVRIAYREGAEGLVQGRAFVAVRSEGVNEYVYEPAEKVAADPFVREIVLREMEREWRTLHRRYEQFEEFVALVSSSLAVGAAG